MLTFNGDPNTKAMLVERAIEHADADRLVQGWGYWSMGSNEGLTTAKWRGCAVGCLATPVDDIAHRSTGLRAWDGGIAQSSAYELLESKFGIPQLLTSMTDDLFERVSKGRYRSLPQRVVEALPVGVETSYLGKELYSYAKRSAFWWADSEVETDGLGRLDVELDTRSGADAARALNALLRELRGFSPSPETIIKQMENQQVEA